MAAIVALGSFAQAADLPLVEGVELQPLAARPSAWRRRWNCSARPCAEQQAALDKALAIANADEAVRQIQQCSTRSAWRA